MQKLHSVSAFFSYYRLLPLLLCGLFTCTLPVLAQSPAKTGQGQRKTVGLVLSGGGAKGLAHVGVLKALEENNIPIDYVVGASMGAIIGGCYAAGYAAKEIEEIVLSDAFQEWSSGKLLLQHRFVPSRREAEADLFSFYVDLDTNFRASVNSNFVDDAPLNFALARLLYKASHEAGHNFDSLDIPFRCTASDIFTQKSVVLQDGHLSDAVRASMTVPLFFRPIRIDGKYLYDGGVYDNFPVKVMRKHFNPDIIIAVNVSSKVFKEYPYGKDDELIADALKYFLLDNTDPGLLNKGDVFLEPNLGNLTAIDFPKVQAFVDSGYAVARASMDSIKQKIPFSLPQSRPGRKTELLDHSEKNIYSIEFQGLLPRQEGFVRRTLGSGRSKVSIDRLSKGYYRLISHSYFNDVYPWLLGDTTSKDGYRFSLKINHRQKARVSLGGNLASRSISRLYAGISYTLLSRALYQFQVNGYSGRFYTSARGMARMHLPTAMPMYLELNGVYNHWDFNNSQEIFFSKNAGNLFLSRYDRFIEGLAGFTVKRQKLLEVGAAWLNNDDFYFNQNNFNTADLADESMFNGMMYLARFSHSSLNRKQFADEGSALKLSLRYYNGQERHNPGSTSIYETSRKVQHQWVMAKASWEKYYGTKLKWGYSLEGVASNQPAFANYTATLLNAPAFYPLLDSRTLFLPGFRAINYAAAGLRQVTPLSGKLQLRLEGYAFRPFRVIAEGEEQQAEFVKPARQVELAASASLIFQPPLGPASASFIYYDDPNQRFGILLNAGYLIFNRRGMD